MELAVWRGLGDGTFEPPSAGFSGPSCAEFTTGDFNADGALDGFGTTSETIVVISNLGGMAFSVTEFDVNEEGVQSPVSADFDRNGLADVAFVAGGKVHVLLNEEGALKPGPILSAGLDSREIAVGDLDGDDRPDLVVTAWGSNDVTVLMNRPQP
jgi:hypothetical protein